MKTSKNFLKVILMVCSLLLLIILELFWLKSSYEKAYFDLSRESSLLFENTVLGLRDSLFVKNIETVTPDSTGRDWHHTSDSFNIRLRSIDSVGKGFRTQIYVSTEVNDSSKNFLRPLASSIHTMEPRRSFIIRIGPDSLNRDALTLRFKKTLDAAGLQYQFHIRHILEHEPFGKAAGFRKSLGESSKQGPQHPFSDTLITDPVSINPLHAYAAVFSNVSATVRRQITPQILFSIVLIGAIATSFSVMYRSLRSQQRLNDMKTDFISNITHELKTPVATVSVALEALKDFNVLDNREKTNEYLGIAHSELNRLTLMTDKILKAAVFENHGIAFSTEKLNFHVIIEKVLSSLTPIFEQHNLKVSYKSDGTDFTVDGSPMHLTNVVYNLLDNAIKYGPHDAAIDITLRDSAGVIQLDIKDWGIGIAKEYQKRIFEKFFRIPTGDVHNVKGYGLGLNYVSQVVKKHGGNIEVRSELGKGSVFIVRLPKQRNL